MEGIEAARRAPLLAPTLLPERSWGVYDTVGTAGATPHLQVPIPAMTARLALHGDHVVEAVTAESIRFATGRAFHILHRGERRSIRGVVFIMGSRHNVAMLLDRIRQEIRSNGPIGFDRFMEIALYDERAGYFGTGRLRSDKGGDFLTSAEVSPLFGATLARFVAAERDRIGEPFSVIEFGGGSGGLLRSLLDSLGPVPRVIALERSAAARAAIATLVPEAEIADEFAGGRGVILANEVLDNMPAALVVRRGAGWRERRVDLAGSGLRLVETDPRSAAVDWADRFGGEVAEGGQVEVQIRAASWVRAQLDLLSAGAVVLIDYGDVAERLEQRRATGTVRTYRDHHLGPDPLAKPGVTDITMDVNFSAMAAAAVDGSAAVELHRQDDFLEQWGLGDQLGSIRRDELSAAQEGRTMDRLELRSRVTGGEALLHPRGLGDFRVLVCRK